MNNSLRSGYASSQAQTREALTHAKRLLQFLEKHQFPRYDNSLAQRIIIATNVLKMIDLEATGSLRNNISKSKCFGVF